MSWYDLTVESWKSIWITFFYAFYAFKCCIFKYLGICIFVSTKWLFLFWHSQVCRWVDVRVKPRVGVAVNESLSHVNIKPCMLLFYNHFKAKAWFKFYQWFQFCSQSTFSFISLFAILVTCKCIHRVYAFNTLWLIKIKSKILKRSLCRFGLSNLITRLFLSSFLKIQTGSFLITYI